jgi:hypothetical protein
MKRTVLMITVCLFGIFYSNVLIAQGGAQLDLTWPVQNSVTQRGTGNSAGVTIAGQLWMVSGGSLPSTLTYKISTCSATGVPGPVVATDILPLGSSGEFHRTVGVSKGWYYLEIEGTLPGSSGPTGFWTSKFGVGDVFVIAGQSNGKGYGLASWDVPATSSLPEWIVSINENNECLMNYPPSYNLYFSKLTEFNRVSPTGENSWCYTVLGKLISDANGGMPVAFFNAAYGGSGIKNWYESRNGGATNDLYAGTQYCSSHTWISPVASYFIGQPFTTLKNALNFYASMFGVRAVLWHQGEAETITSVVNGGIKDIATYQTYLRAVITQSRTVFNSNLSWMVANVSYIGGSTTPNVVTAQGNVAADANNFLGANSDTRMSGYRDAGDNTHFKESRSSGLTTLATDWKGKIDNSGTTGFVWIAANTPPVVTVMKSGSNRTLTATSGGSEYRWGNNINTATSTGTTKSITFTSPSHTVLRCYKRVGNNWTASARIAIGTSYCTSCREASQNENSIENELGIGFKTYPNPLDKELTIEFDVAQDEIVKLDLMDEQGRILKTVANGPHAKGHFRYPMIKIDHPATRIAFCRITMGQTAYTKRLLISSGD